MEIDDEDSRIGANLGSPHGIHKIRRGPQSPVESLRRATAPNPATCPLEYRPDIPGDVAFGEKVR